MSIALYLSSIGLDDNEQKAYFALLGLGDAEASRVASRAGLKRSTAFSVLEGLLRKGLVSSYRERNIKRFVAENPKKIKESLEGKLAAFEKYLPELQKVYATGGGPAKVRFFEGPDGHKSILEEALECREKVTRSMGSLEKAKEAIGSSIGYSRRRWAKGIFARNLRVKGEKFSPTYFERQREKLRDIRFLPERVRLPLMMHVWDNKVAILTSKAESFGVIIESKEFSLAMKSIFDMLWDVSEKTA